MHVEWCEWNDRHDFQVRLVIDANAKEWVRPYYLKWFYSRVFSARYPPEFSRCWDYPSIRGSQRLPESDMGLTRSPDVVFLPAADWHARVQRSHHLASGLAKCGHRCFFLNPHLGREFPSPYPFSRRTEVRLLGSRVYELHVHLPREPVYHHRLLTLGEHLTVARTIEGLLTEVGSTRPTVVVSLPLWTPVARELKNRLGCRIIYDCHDLWSGFRRIHPDILSTESELFSLSDVVTFSARWLMNAKVLSNASLPSKSVLIRNGVQPDDFDFLPRRDLTERKTVGYAGALDFWFDVTMVKLAAQQHPEWNFIFFGRIENHELLTLRALPNVRFIGEVPYSSLRHHFASVDVCMIPFRISPLTMATNPLKLYEYFACGLPVVSSALPEVLELEELVYIANTPSEFVKQLEAAMAEHDPRKAEQRRRVAEEENWMARCALLASQLQPEEQLSACR